MIRAVFFDLDGTLADTAPDLGFVLNLLRQARGPPGCAAGSRKQPLSFCHNLQCRRHDGARLGSSARGLI